MGKLRVLATCLLTQCPQCCHIEAFRHGGRIGEKPLMHGLFSCRDHGGNRPEGIVQIKGDGPYQRLSPWGGNEEYSGDCSIVSELYN